MSDPIIAKMRKQLRRRDTARRRMLFAILALGAVAAVTLAATAALIAG